MTDLCLSIVTYNSENDLCRILESLRNTVGVSLQTIFVDNHSSDGSVSMIRSSGVDHTLLITERNIGFAAANNRAIQRADARYLLVANPDVYFESDLLRKCVDYMDAHPDIALMTPRLLNTDGSQQYTPKRKPKLSYLAAGFVEGKTGRKQRLRSEYTLRDAGLTETTDIDFCPGCFLFARAEMLKACGGFDERFFLYFEDADLTLRMQEFGRTVYNPALTVNHYWHRDNHNAKGLRFELMSMVRFLWKWRGKSGRMRQPD